MKRFFCYIILIGIAFQLYGKVGTGDLRERVYLQTDKQLYLAGEAIWMKLFTTNSDFIPISFSKVAYVELIDSVAQIQIKVELTNGVGQGRMQLSPDLPTGYYRLIAYTQFMRNEGSEVFFEKNIGIVNTFHSGDMPQASKTENNISPDETYDHGAVSLQTDQSTYTTRDHGELLLNGLPKDIHTLSVSISGKDCVPVAEPDILSFRKKRSTILPEFTGKFLPEYEGHILTGKIVDNQTGVQVMDDVLLTSGLSFTGEGFRFFVGQKNETGDVRFYTSNISGTKEIATIAYHSNDRYRVDIQSPFVFRHDSKQITALHVDSTYFRQLLERSVALQVFHYFSEDPSENITVTAPIFKLKPSMSYPLDEYTRFTTMREVFIEFIVGARFRSRDGKREISLFTKRGNYLDFKTIPLVMLDGVPISDHDIIYNYDPLSVEKINIYYGPCSLGGYLFDGIVELTTYRRLHQDLNLNKSTQIITYEGTQPHYRFFTTDYSDEKNRQSRLPDGRHTLLWNPDISTDGNSSIRLPFNTSDLTGEFQINVEGITKNGNVIFAKSSFIVEPAVQ